MVEAWDKPPVGDIDDLLDAVAAVAEPGRRFLSDADDDMVLETAVNGRAEAMVTFNRRRFVSVPKQLGIEVLPPAGIVTQLGTKS
jgi:predicted nucleic acid-binding protein